MVRIKHRYLLVNILYPEPETKSRIAHPSSGKPLPDVIQFHRPSPDDLTPQLLARSIKDQIALLYGDYGVGLTSGGLNGEDPQSGDDSSHHVLTKNFLDSKISIPGNIDRHCPMRTRSLPPCLGGDHFHDGTAKVC